MTRMLRTHGLALALLVCASCTSQPAAPIDPALRDALHLDISIDRTEFAIGDSAEVTIALRNEGADSVTLVFGSTCQIMPFVETRAGAARYPGDGGWACGAAITSLAVPPNGSVERRLVLRGVGAPTTFTSTSLAPGRYRVHARIDPYSPAPSLRSADVEFEVR